MQKNLVVYNSSAGSGKTYTLVKEYLTLALKADSPFYFRKILAITFTNKAAAEMKERVLFHLSILSLPMISGEKDKQLFEDYLRVTGLTAEKLSEKATRIHKAMLHHYADISISTIDSFVHRLVRAFSKDLGLVSDFDVETNADEILQTAVDRLLSEVGSDNEITDVLLQFTNQRADDEKGWNVDQEVFKFSKILLKEESIDPIKKLNRLNLFDFTEIKNELQVSVKATEKKLKEICEKAIKIITDSGLSKEDFQYGNAGAISIFYKGLSGELDKVSVSPRVQNVLKDGEWKASAKGNAVKETIASRSDELFSLLNEINTLIGSQQQIYVSRKNISRNIYNLSLLSEVNKRCDQIKQEKGIVLISDLNRLITGIIMDEPAPFIYERLGERYSNILIDEFQDTSVLQWNNFIPLIENSLANGNFNMLVGDAKQSIYRWRSGEMEQLVNLPSIYSQNDLSLLQKERERIFDLNFKPETLNVNYRSKNEIVGFNNAFFKNYYDKLRSPLRKVYETYFQKLPSDKPGGYVEIKVISKDTKDRAQAYLEMTLEKIKKNLEDGFALSDIVVLCRQKTEGALVASYLSENNIPVISGDSLLLGNSDEVKVLISFFQWYSDTANETAAVRLIESFSSHLSISVPLHELVSNYSKHENGFRKIDVFQFLRDNHVNLNNDTMYSYSFYQLVEDITKNLKLNRNDPFISTLLDHVLSFSSRGGFTLSEFLQWWNESGKTKAAGSVQQAEAVKIMTIHKSKGLQFPVVVFPFVNWKIKKGSEWIWSDLRYNECKNLSTTLMKVNKDMELAGYADLLNSESEKTAIDQINLLYVAFTRAEERLYIFSDEKNKGDFINPVFLENIPAEMQHENNAFFWGKETPVAKEKRAKVEEVVLKNRISLDWKDHLRVSFDSSKAESSGLAYFGNILHDLLSRIDKISECDGALEIMYKKGLVSKEEMNKLKTAIDTMFENPFMRELFSENAIARKEFELMDKNGHLYRADRLVQVNGRNILIDFKTGVKKKIHSEQINLYAALLEESGFNDLEKFLYYTAENEFVKV